MKKQCFWVCIQLPWRHEGGRVDAVLSNQLQTLHKSTYFTWITTVAPKIAANPTFGILFCVSMIFVTIYNGISLCWRCLDRSFKKIDGSAQIDPIVVSTDSIYHLRAFPTEKWWPKSFSDTDPPTTVRSSVRSFVRFGSENNHFFSTVFWGGDMENHAFYCGRFRALEILGFSSFKKKMPKSWISL